MSRTFCRFAVLRVRRRAGASASAACAGPSAASRRHLPSISLASQTLPFGPLRYPRANPRVIGTQYPDFLPGSLARAERVSSLALRTVRAIAESDFPKNSQKYVGGQRRTYKDGVLLGYCLMMLILRPRMSVDGRVIPLSQRQHRFESGRGRQ